MKKWALLCIMSLTLLLAACAKRPDSSPHTGSPETVQIPPINSQDQEVLPSDTENPSSENMEPTEENGKFYDVETAVSAAILDKNMERYLAGECAGEGHIILSTEEEKDQVTVYMLAMFGWYQFQDGNFVKSSGSDAIPTVMTFQREKDGSYLLSDYKTAQDGSLYTPSIKELFPEKFWDICIIPSEDDRNELREQEQNYAAAYLKELGRKAKIGDYSDFEHTLLTDAGVSVEVSNRLGEQKDELLSRCPGWLGNVENVEKGIRYQYTTAYAPEKKEIIFSKVDLTTNKMVEEAVFHSESGELIRHKK